MTRRAVILFWQLLILASLLVVWQWGFEWSKALLPKAYVPKILDPYFIAKPSAIWERGRLYKNPFGLDLKIVNRTLEEADACRRDGITITTFMIATDSYLVAFVDKLTKINRGRAYYASPYNLAEFLFTDYIRNRKKFVH